MSGGSPQAKGPWNDQNDIIYACCPWLRRPQVVAPPRKPKLRVVHEVVAPPTRELTDDDVLFMRAVEVRSRKKPLYRSLTGWALVPLFPKAVSRMLALKREGLLRSKSANSYFVRLTDSGAALLDGHEPKRSRYWMFRRTETRKRLHDMGIKTRKI